MGDDHELFGVMVGYLTCDGQRYLQDIKAALLAGDAVRVHQRAHSLKGVISNFGTGRAWHAATKMEGLARAGSMVGMHSSLAELESALDELMGALKPYLANENSG